MASAIRDNYLSPHAATTNGNRRSPTSKHETTSKHGVLSEEESDRFGQHVRSTKKLSKADAAGLRQLHDALELIPDEDKKAYLQALQRAPHLVQLESDPLRFLKCETYNAWTAARKLVNYWETRRELFGDDLAFLPMMMAQANAHSAISHPHDIELLASGSICLLPPDQRGRTVLFMDRGRVPTHLLRATNVRLRVAFYLCSIACENERTQQEGIVVLALASRPNSNCGKSGYDFEFPRRFANFMLHALPAKVANIHLLLLPKLSGRGSFMQAVLNVSLKMIGSVFRNICETHAGEAEKDLLPQLKSFGLAKKDIPESVGGSYKLDSRLGQWRKRQRKIENERYMSEAEKLDRKRKINVVHSRQKRQRRKIEFEVVESQVMQLNQRNSELHSEQLELENLLQQAQEAVRRFEAGETVFPVTMTGSKVPIVSVPLPVPEATRSAAPDKISWTMPMNGALEHHSSTGTVPGQVTAPFVGTMDQLHPNLPGSVAVSGLSSANMSRLAALGALSQQSTSAGMSRANPMQAAVTPQAALESGHAHSLAMNFSGFNRSAPAQPTQLHWPTSHHAVASFPVSELEAQIFLAGGLGWHNHRTLSSMGPVAVARPAGTGLFENLSHYSNALIQSLTRSGETAVYESEPQGQQNMPDKTKWR